MHSFQKIMRRLLPAVIAGFTLGVGNHASGQFDSENVTLLGHIDLGTFGASTGNDCWGYTAPSGREYALMGLSNKVAFVDVTDPTNPDWFASVPHTSSTWCDIKVYEDHAYIVTEAGSGIQVVDMSDIDNRNITLVRTIGSPHSSHNVAIDPTSGFLYTCGSGGAGATTVFFDLSDPGNPTVAGTWDDAYQHDIQPVTYTDGPNAGREILFGASEGRGLDIIDVTDKSAPFRVSRTAYANVAYTHQVWTEDQRYLYINDELDSIARTTVMDIQDLANPLFKNDFSSGLPATDHNQYVRDGFLYAANYRSGLRIFDLNADPLDPPQVGFFDTFPSDDAGGFDGAWSVYPFFPSGTVLISDINRGLFIVDVRNAIRGRLTFTYPDGRPEVVSPAGGTSMLVEIASTSANVELQPGSPMLFVDDGSGFTGTPMAELSPGLYEATFPATACGSRPRFYVTAESTDNDVFSDPNGAPASAYETISATGFDIVLDDNFQSDLGWSVENIDLSSGAWERGVPSGGGSRGDPPTDFDGSGMAYVTGNSSGDEDVDGGPTRLMSPALDLSSSPNAVISVALWMSNDDGDDDLVVELSNNNGATWTTVETTRATSGWEQRSYTITDFVTPSNAVRMRFSVSDNPNDSVTEAGVDAFRVSSLQCGGTELTGFSIVFGTLVSGGLAELFEADDQYLVARSAFGFSASEPNIVDLVVNGETTVADPAWIDYTFEGKLNNPGGSATVRFFNWATEAFESVGSFSIDTNETTEVFENIDASAYVRPATDRIRTSLRVSVIATFSASGFDLSTDQVNLSVQ